MIYQKVGQTTPKISASHVTGQSSDLYREENSPPNYSPHPPPPTVSPPVVGGAWSVTQGQRSGRRRGEDLGESSPRTHRVHRLCTHTVHTVHRNQFFTGTVCTILTAGQYIKLV